MPAIGRLRYREANPQGPTRNGTPPPEAPALTEAQAGAARAMKAAGVKGQAAVDLLGRYGGAERISELTDADAELLAAELRTSP